MLFLLSTIPNIMMWHDKWGVTSSLYHFRGRLLIAIALSFALMTFLSVQNIFYKPILILFEQSKFTWFKTRAYDESLRRFCIMIGICKLLQYYFPMKIKSNFVFTFWLIHTPTFAIFSQSTIHKFLEARYIDDWIYMLLIFHKYNPRRMQDNEKIYF